MDDSSDVDDDDDDDDSNNETYRAEEWPWWRYFVYRQYFVDMIPTKKNEGGNTGGNTLSS
jgi:hypothetical protein